ncbi:MAG TPA: hypothetical protein VN788_02380 [Verrucomicrobiae bacterium]|nr:hypothetical protein [Verrucomicrobiae bacterium]
MDRIYDIFRKMPDNSPIWVESVDGLEALKERLLYLASTKPNEYLVYDHGLQRFIDPFDNPREFLQAK